MDLKTAVKCWIQAECEFRFGKYHHSFQAQEAYVAAECRLREALTGKRGLLDAAKKLYPGVKIEGDPVQGDEKSVYEVPIKKPVKKLIKRGGG